MERAGPEITDAPPADAATPSAGLRVPSPDDRPPAAPGGHGPGADAPAGYEPGAPGPAVYAPAVHGPLGRLERALAGRYALEREAGRGGMAVVYLARDVRHRRPVALKILHPALAASLSAGRFLREIETAANLNHPHILPLFDSGVVDGMLFYVMPFVAGESLRDRLRRRAAEALAEAAAAAAAAPGEARGAPAPGALPAGEVVRLTREVAGALDYAHRQGVVHRDVKPENILLDDGGHARVADFGVALATGLVAHAPPDRPAAERAAPAAGPGAAPDLAAPLSTGPTGAGAPTATSTLTAAGMVVGTPAYMSPEQAEGNAEVGAASDQYALACVAFEMLTGRRAFKTDGSGLYGVAARVAPRVGDHRGDLPAAVDAVLARALARRPADRYPSAGAFAAALAAALEPAASAPAASAPAAPEPAARPRWPRAARAAAAAVVAAAALGLGAGVLRDRVAPPRTPAGAAAPVVVASLAVLPFDNQGDSADAYFADGITDELRGRLSALGNLRVVASGSSRQYRGTAKPPTQIARELGVRYLLVGRVRRSRGPGGARQIRVAPELVDVTGGPAPSVRWQQSFDGPLADVFRVQDEIATRVAERLQVALGAGEARRLATPAASLDAYDLYLRAQAALARGGVEDLRQAVALYDDVVRRDSAFALAWAGIVTAEASLYNIDRAGAADHRDRARRAAARALALAPDLPDVQAAVAHYTTYVRKDPARALADLAAARVAAPYHALLLRRVAAAERALGRLDAAVTRSQEVVRLDPRSAGAYFWLGLSLADLRRYAEARAAFARTAELQPTAPHPWVRGAVVELAAGDSAAARAVLRRARATLDANVLAANVGRHGYDAVWLLDSADQRAVRQRGTAAFAPDDRGNAGLVLAELFALRGDARRARAYGDTAAAAFRAQLRTLAANPQVAAEVRARAAVALARAGRAVEAVREAEEAAAEVPLGTGEHPIAYNVQLELVRVYLLAGDRERALAGLAALLDTPGVVSPGWLRVDPAFAPLRADPRFARLASRAG
jgi:serine/threonine-protein kinase